MWPMVILGALGFGVVDAELLSHSFSEHTVLDVALIGESRDSELLEWEEGLVTIILGDTVDSLVVIDYK